jgi:putative transposase
MATRKKHSPEEIVRKLQQADRLSAEGNTVAEICRQLQVAEPTYYKWRKQFAGMSVEDAKELKALREENARLKRLVAEAELEKLALKEIAKGKF